MAKPAMDIHQIASVFKRALLQHGGANTPTAWPQTLTNSDLLKLFRSEIDAARSLGVRWEEIAKELARAGIHKKTGALFTGPEIRVYASRWPQQPSTLSLETGATPAPRSASPPAIISPATVLDSFPKRLIASLTSTKHQLPATEQHSVAARMLIRLEAMSSSRMDGVRCTLEDLLTLEARGENTDLPSRPQSVHKVRQYVLALERFIPVVREGGPTELTVELIHHLHQIVVMHTSQSADNPIYRKGIDVDQIKTWLADLAEYMQQLEEDPVSAAALARAAIAHAHFDAMQPFAAGNGRVGRLLLTLMLSAYGFRTILVSKKIEQLKTEYIAALRRAQEAQNWTHLVSFIGNSLAATQKEDSEIDHGIVDLPALWKHQPGFRNGSAAYRTLDLLPSYPVVTARLLTNLLMVNRAASYKGIEQLVGAGILVELTGNLHSRTFAAPAVLRVLEGALGEQ
ncbi:Fic family protein [Azospirillum rugosum]|uniref:Fic family protein n=1 Tax=Azospirillum rugosum TaxID=416170 RepID=A0ABS4SI29_9PROT|nr:Fic family protein [Azospirillum rugosum]MBP2292231.1 Fic family protein [Azospirillum rugosum]MDQ0525990.1 Fic family protein [Azospirillum rugosum]